MEWSPPVGLVLPDEGCDLEGLFERFVARLQGEGVDVAGVLQRDIPADDGNKAAMQWMTVSDNQTTIVSLPPGKSVRGCRIDLSAVAEVSHRLRLDLDRNPDLIVINKFGRLESEGGGLSAEMMEAMAQAIPLLVSLPEAYREIWDAVTDGAGVPLAAREETLIAWWREASAG